MENRGKAGHFDVREESKGKEWSVKARTLNENEANSRQVWGGGMSRSLKPGLLSVGENKMGVEKRARVALASGGGVSKIATTRRKWGPCPGEDRRGGKSPAIDRLVETSGSGDTSTGGTGLEPYKKNGSQAGEDE